MAEDHIPPNPSQPSRDHNLFNSEEPAAQKPPRRWSDIWEGLLRMGLGEITIRTGTVLASIVLVVLVVWVMGSFYLKGNVRYSGDAVAAIAAPLPTATATVPPPPFKLPANAGFERGITRLALIHTTQPDRPRFEMVQYTVQSGDTLFGIGEKFGIKPQSIMFTNLETLLDDPHRLQVGQVLTVPPVDGALYKWHQGDGLNGVSKFFSVTPEDIINWPGNNLTTEKVGDFANPNIAVDTVIFIPGGKRAFASWSAPFVSRKDPAKAKVFGPGYCGTVVDGYVGSGSFVWPSTEHWLSGYDFSPETNHWGIDIAGKLGNSIFAADSGVVVYAGWNDYGYGNAIIIDHGNGLQTLYGHLSQLFVGCGESVSQGATIAAMGSTGRSSGPHLHFEIMNASGVRLNPWGYVSK